MVYVGKDLENLEGEEYRLPITVLSDFKDSIYAISGNYRGLEIDGKLAKNSEIDIYSAEVFSPMHHNKLLTAEVTVLRNNVVFKEISKLKVEEDFKLKLDEIGSYSIIYSTPGYDNSNVYSVDFEVVDNYPLFIGSALEKLYAYNETISIPNLTATLNDESKNATITFYDPDGNRILNTQNVKLDKPGEYRVNYLVRFETNYIYTKFFNVGYSSANLFSTDDLGVTVEHNSDTGDLYPGKIPGIVIGSEMNNGSAIYNRNLDLSTVTKNDSLIEIAVLPSEIGKLDFWQFTVRLTDVHDPKNFVDISVYKGNWGNEWSYVKAGANGQVKSGWENGVVLNAYHTGSPIGFSFTGESLFGHELIRLYYDNQEKAVYVDNIKRPGYFYGNQVIDLDSLDCFSETTLWKGFSTGEVTLSIHFEYVQTTESKLLVKSIAGVDLGGEFISDNEGPIINVDLEEYNLSDLPKGIVGVKYPVFKAKAFDKINGFVDYSVKVYKDYQTINQTEVTATKDYFLPDVPGVYSIVYTAKDLMENANDKVVIVEVLESISVLDYLYEKEIETTAKVGEIFTLPSGVAIGGSGNKTVSITIKDPNGNIINLENRELKFLLEGTYTITATLIDYLKQTADVVKEIEVSVSEYPIIYDFQIPLYFINGFEYTLPDFEAFDYATVGTVGM